MNWETKALNNGAKMLNGVCPGCGCKGVLLRYMSKSTRCIQCGAFWPEPKDLRYSRRERKRRMGKEPDMFGRL